VPRFGGSVLSDCVLIWVFRGHCGYLCAGWQPETIGRAHDAMCLLDQRNCGSSTGCGVLSSTHFFADMLIAKRELLGFARAERSALLLIRHTH
jgi:hypothetical protein